MKCYAIGKNKCLVETNSKKEYFKFSYKEYWEAGNNIALRIKREQLPDDWYDADGHLNYVLVGGYVGTCIDDQIDNYFPIERFAQYMRYQPGNADAVYCTLQNIDIVGKYLEAELLFKKIRNV